MKPKIRWLYGAQRSLESQGRDWLGIFFPPALPKSQLRLRLKDSVLQYFSFVAFFDAKGNRLQEIPVDAPMIEMSFSRVPSDLAGILAAVECRPNPSSRSSSELQLGSYAWRDGISNENFALVYRLERDAPPLGPMLESTQAWEEFHRPKEPPPKPYPELMLGVAGLQLKNPVQRDVTVWWGGKMISDTHPRQHVMFDKRWAPNSFQIPAGSCLPSVSNLRFPRVLFALPIMDEDGVRGMVGPVLGHGQPLDSPQILSDYRGYVLHFNGYVHPDVSKVRVVWTFKDQCIRSTELRATNLRNRPEILTRAEHTPTPADPTCLRA